MNMTMIEERDVIKTILPRDQETFIRCMRRFPIVSLTLMRACIQIPDLDGVLNWMLETPDADAGGRPYMSEIPRERRSQDRRNKDRAERYYLTRYHDTLQPLFYPQKMVLAPLGERSREQQRLINALTRFPILTPSLMQSALNGITAEWWREDMESLVDMGLVTLWRKGERAVQDDVTARGMRYFLTIYRERLQVFLLREG